MTFLITGGAGYIGAHVVRAMLLAGEEVVVLDDLSTGNEDRVPEGVGLVVGSVLDRLVVDEVIRKHKITGVVHLAGKKQVGESVAKPMHYYHENVQGLAVLLQAVADAGIRNFLFSSSASVYGMPDVDLVTEDTPCAPMSPYGETKLAGEWLVRAAGRAHGISTACLRYFNVAGAATPNSPTPASSTWSRWSSSVTTRARAPRSSVTTTRRRTAPASVTTSMSRTSRRPTWRPPASSPSGARPASTRT